MKITVIGQACLLVESQTDRLIIDPWIVGSCYWRSWWHLPPPRVDLVRPEAISAIYFTHEHTDHLHFPSLRRFPTNVRILVAQFPIDRMVRAIQDRGYSHVEEIPHGRQAKIGSLQLFSYQYGTDDSVVVVTDGKTTVLNMNDTKPAGLALRQIMTRHPKIDFLFKSHSPAQSYPGCYTADDPKDVSLLPLSSYIHSFISIAETVRPQWAVPFASNICHLHPESRSQNVNLVFPTTLAEGWKKELNGGQGPQLRLMPPGAFWDSQSGFGGTSPDPLPIAEQIDRLAAEKSAIVTNYIQEEATRPAITFESFKGYFDPFLQSVPWMLRKMYPARVAFEAPGGAYFIVDLKERRVTQTSQRPQDVHSISIINPHLFQDAVSKAGVNLIGISKRIRVHLKPGGVVCDAAFWGILTIYELGYLPLANLFTVRSFLGLARRWREMIGYIPAFVRPSKSLELIIESAQPSSSQI